jgi:hypothetical protein
MKELTKASFTWLAIALLFSSQRAEAGIVVDIVEASDGNSVTVTASGTLTYHPIVVINGFPITVGTLLRTEANGLSSVMQYTPEGSQYAASDSYGSGDFSNWTGKINSSTGIDGAVTGEAGFGWRFTSTFIYIHKNYVSGAQYDSSTTVNITSSTVTPGSYATYTMSDSVGGDTVRFQYSVASSSSGVPEPSTAIAMGLLGIVGFAGNRRRRRQESVA